MGPRGYADCTDDGTIGFESVDTAVGYAITLSEAATTIESNDAGATGGCDSGGFAVCIHGKVEWMSYIPWGSLG